MRVLVDQNLPEALAARLLADGHDAIHTTAAGLERATDPEVFALCVVQDRLLITADKKLTKFLASERSTGPSIVVLRGFHRSGDAAAAVSANLRRVEQTITELGPAVFSLSPGQPIRVELLPIGLTPEE